MLRKRNSQRNDPWARLPYSSSYSSLLATHLNQKLARSMGSKHTFNLWEPYKGVQIPWKLVGKPCVNTCGVRTCGDR